MDKFSPRNLDSEGQEQYGARSCMYISPRVIKRLRLNRGWSQDELAVHAGVSRNTVFKMEAGGYMPRPSTAKKIADVLGVLVEDIVVDKEGVVSGAVGQAIAN